MRYLLYLLLLVGLPAQAQLQLDAETGGLLSVPYLETRIPGETGTFIDLKNDLTIQKRPFVRLRLSYTINDRHTLSLLAAPLIVASEGSISRPVLFNGVTFPADVPLRTEYQFNTYRLTYRYAFVRSERVRLAAGLTAFARDGDVRVESATQQQGNRGLGVLPLLNIYASWKPVNALQVIVEGDGLGSPNGRAIDLFGGVAVQVTDWLAIKGGYRVVEGKADNEEVFTRAWFNFASGGVLLTIPGR
ncbi:porin family protein [Tellurirhabdus rosea]|uniref:hypothetical protein n=1 Tax=Tellurirhabdus rosea TaxID=2674997 RepID=UPI002255DAA7|nr:hypothetical protein [Tellurirhabdus rosea]